MRDLVKALKTVFLLLFILMSASHADASPNRIVSLSPVGTEILYMLGQERNIAAVTNFCDYPPEAKQKPKVGGFTDVSMENLIAMNADLIVLQDLHKKLALNLEKLGVPYVTIRQESVEDIYDSIVAVGKACGAEEQAERLSSEIKSQINDVAAKAASLPKRRVLLCVSRELSEPRISVFYAAGGKTFYDELITLAGGENVLKDFEAAYPRVSAEGLVALDPEAIIDLVGDSAYYHSPGNIDKETVFSEERLMGQWKSGPQVEAVRDGRVSILRGTMYLRPGPRITEILRVFAEAIHPEEQW